MGRPTSDAGFDITPSTVSGTPASVEPAPTADGSVATAGPGPEVGHEPAGIADSVVDPGAGPPAVARRTQRTRASWWPARASARRKAVRLGAARRWRERKTYWAVVREESEWRLRLLTELLEDLARQGLRAAAWATHPRVLAAAGVVGAIVVGASVGRFGSTDVTASPARVGSAALYFAVFVVGTCAALVGASYVVGRFTSLFAKWLAHDPPSRTAPRALGGWRGAGARGVLAAVAFVYVLPIVSEYVLAWFGALHDLARIPVPWPHGAPVASGVPSCVGAVWGLRWLCGLRNWVVSPLASVLPTGLGRDFNAGAWLLATPIGLYLASTADQRSGRVPDPFDVVFARAVVTFLGVLGVLSLPAFASGAYMFGARSYADLAPIFGGGGGDLVRIALRRDDVWRPYPGLPGPVVLLGKTGPQVVVVTCVPGPRRAGLEVADSVLVTTVTLADPVRMDYVLLPDSTGALGRRSVPLSVSRRSQPKTALSTEPGASRTAVRGVATGSAAGSHSASSPVYDLFDPRLCAYLAAVRRDSLPLVGGGLTEPPPSPAAPTSKRPSAIQPAPDRRGP